MKSIIIGAAVVAVAISAGAEPFTAEREKGNARTAIVAVDFSEDCGPVKPMNAVNNGPTDRAGVRQHDNFETWKAARIPYGRTHDASEYIVYGGDHCVDITAIFPNFDADENDPKNYDFAVTDVYLRNMREAGTEPFFRLGQRIEHSARRYNIYPPKDYAKWARICEHIILHYNHGWADGYEWNIRYWEIWNEPDGDWEIKKKPLPNTWGGTSLQFFEFYETAAKYLKGRFPDLKIGGPALAGTMEWADKFFAYQHEHKTPVDFFSWHSYNRKPEFFVYLAKVARGILEKYGYEKAESILNEWNYIKGWKEEYHHSIMTLASQKGAAFAAASMIACQHAPVDMLMYYDAKPDAHFNGMFDKVSLMPLKPYYAIYAWGSFAAMCDRSVKVSSDVPDIYAVAGRGADRRRAIFLARYSDDDNFASKRLVTVRLSKGTFPREVTSHITDDVRTYTEMKMWPAGSTELSFRMAPHSFTMLEYIEPPARDGN